MRVGGDASLNGAAASGAVIMAGAQISGALTLTGAEVAANSYGNALNCKGSRIGRDLLLDTGPGGKSFKANGAVRLAGVEIAGHLRQCVEHLQLQTGSRGEHADQEPCLA